MDYCSGFVSSVGLLAGLFAYHLWMQGLWQAAACLLLISLCALGSSFSRAYVGWREYRAMQTLERRLAFHGDAKMADANKIRQVGLTNNDPGTSLHLGAANGQLLSYSGSSHLVTVAPNNEGKTESVVIPNALAIGHNAIFTDKGGEVANGLPPKKWRVPVRLTNQGDPHGKENQAAIH